MTPVGLRRTVLVSVDVEPDVSMFAHGVEGLRQGLPRLTDLFRKLDTPSDFFCTLDAARLVPDFVRDVTAQGQHLGCHGRDHETAYYSSKPRSWQRRAVQEATEGLRDLCGQAPRFFRAPNFSVSPEILRTLDALGYSADSSVLPGRRKKRYRTLPLLDHRGAPRTPYHPDSQNPCAPGALRLWEVPVTENPLAQGGPIGLGFVNANGPDDALEAVRRSQVSIVTFLCHTWEAIDLGRLYPRLPTWLTETCRADLDGLARFLRGVKREFDVARLQDLLPRLRSAEEA